MPNLTLGDKGKRVTMPKRTIVVIGASAGGLSAFRTIVGALPADFPAALFIIQHVAATGPGLLPELLASAGPLPARHAVDGAAIRPGTITVAPPDQHLLIQRGHVHLVRGPKENGFRPAIDAGLRSAALAYGPQMIGVILTGMLDDGTAGLLAVKRYGGLAIVQEPEEAPYPSMPANARRYVAVDLVCPIAEIAPNLVKLVTPPAPAFAPPEHAQTEREQRTTAIEPDRADQAAQIGAPSIFSCPTCGGVLVEYYDNALLRYRCQIGHAYSPESFLAEQAAAHDTALWTAFRALNERVNFAQRLTEEARRLNDAKGVQRFHQLREQAQAQQERLRRLLLQFNDAPTEPDDPPPPPKHQ